MNNMFMMICPMLDCERCGKKTAHSTSSLLASDNKD